MGRMLMPDDACREVDIVGARSGITTRYGSMRGGTGVVEVTSPAHAKALREAGLTVASTAGVIRGRGFLCPACGFHGFFRTCRCGHAAEKES